MSNEPHVHRFTRANFDKPMPNPWAMYRKKVATRAVRIDGPFEVETSEGTLSCKDGWLCIDERGYPYPVAADEFALIYEPEIAIEVAP